jgi:hypothetical protein
VTRGWLSFALALLAAGCGAGAQVREAAPPAKPDGAGDRKPLTELDALEHDLSISEQRLEAQLVRREQALADSSDRELESSKKKAESSAEAPAEERDEAPAAEKPRPRAGAQAPGEPPDLDEAPAKTGKVGSPCDMACRALSSMRRSAERICALAGAADERCMRARGRVSSAEERIRRAQCECVNGGSEKLNARAQCESGPCRQDPA